MKNIKWKIKYPCQLGILFIVVSLIYLVLFLQIINNQKIALGVKVVDRQECAKLVNNVISFIYQDKEWLSNLTDLGFELDYQTTIQKAYQIGKGPNFFINTRDQLSALIGRIVIELVYQIDQEKFQEKTSQLFQEIERPAQNASLIFDESADDFLLQHSSEGITIDRERLLSDLSERIKSFSKQPINLDLVFDYPEVKNNEVDSARQKAQKILAGQPYQIILETNIWTIDKKHLINWFEFKPITENKTDNQILGLFLDREQIKKYLEKITSTINQYPIEARLKTEGNQAIVFRPDEEGFGIEIDKTVDQLIQNILVEPPVKKTTMVAQKLLPKITLKQTNKLGIDALIGQGISNFSGSPKNRIHNIKTGLVKFNGLILNPGQEFSFNNLLGGSGPEEGFLPELVIKKDKTVPEYGGGLCQVSTTFFRAAVNSGLEITQRTPHAFPVEYYHPQGFDATVYEPSPDLCFINNTPAHLLIEGLVQGSQLTFNFYGTDNGRQVKIKGPYLLEKKEDGSMKTVLTQEVYQNKELISEQTFYSNYDSPDLYPIEIAE